MPVDAEEFHLEECKLLKHSISTLMDRISTILQYVFGRVFLQYTRGF
jgi:hypothetical protein